MDAHRGLARGDLANVPGVPESRLDAATAARLPGDPPPPPPWELRLDAVLWVQRATAAARTVLPPALRPALPLGIAGFVRYRASPVGPYHELMASPTLVRGGLWRLHVPLVAVDSEASLHGGRAYWALPKTLARFSGEVADGRTVEARGPGWSAGAGVRALGPALPAWLRVSLAQVWPDGSVLAFPATFRGKARLARVSVTVDAAASFARWLTPGSHVGVLLTGARMRLPAVPAPRT